MRGILGAMSGSPAPWRTRGSVERFVAAAPEEVYRVVSDVTSTGQRSEECRSAAWLPGGPQTAQVGARFRWRNRFRVARWSRVCEVVEADPGRTFAFRTVPQRVDLSRADSTTWRYDLLPQDGGTLLRHSYEVHRLPLQPFRALYGALLPHHRDMRPAMQHTLDRVADAVETPSSSAASVTPDGGARPGPDAAPSPARARRPRERAAATR